MSIGRFPDGFRIEPLLRDHPRKAFRSGKLQVDDWIATKAFQNQEKHLSVTRVLVAASGTIAGYYTLATGQVDFSDLPQTVIRKLPRRQLPVATLAWLGVDRSFQSQGLGKLLLAKALRDCHDAGKTFAFIAVILDCVDDSARAFYRRFQFRELPGHPYRLFLSASELEALMSEMAAG